MNSFSISKSLLGGTCKVTGVLRMLRDLGLVATWPEVMLGLVTVVAAQEDVGKPWAGPLYLDTSKAQGHDEAAKAMAVVDDNPLIRWEYRVWCETGYLSIDSAGNNQPVDQIPDPKRDVVSPKGFFYRQYNEQMPAGGVQFLDNAWFFGTDNLGAVVVKTDNGLLLFDVLTTWADMQEQIIDQMPAAGLAPADIKYIFIGHRHGDHIGGINLLLQNHTQDAIIVAGEPDAMWIEEQRAAVINGSAPLPSDAGTNLSAEAIKSLRQKQLNELPSRVDIRVPAFEGVKTGTKRIDTGGTEVVAILNPGHTPGQLSAIVPVKQNGKDHRLLVWSGNDKLEEAKQYTISADFARGVAEREGADVFINTHAYQSASFYHLRRLKEEVEAPNPFVMGADGVSRFLGIFTACQRATKQRFEDGTWFSWE